MSKKQEIVSDATFKVWPFASDFNSACKDGRVTTETCKYHCSLVISPTITIVVKSSILNVAEFLDPSLKTSPCRKTRPISSENHSFFLLFQNIATFIESHCFSLLLFTAWWSIFDKPFRRLLPLFCFYESSQCLFKVKITCKRVNFIKSKIRLGYACLW